MLTIDKIYDAQKTLKGIIRNTEIIKTDKIIENTTIYLKPEILQVTGAFKIRGAYNKISKLTKQEKEKGVITCSAGNHGQGVALAARMNNVKSIVCLPDSAPIAKVEAIRNYGAQIVMVEGVYDDAHDEAIRLQQEHGYTFIHPFDDEEVIAGQGTIGLEILSQIDDLDAIVVPIGGGGLISGIAYAAKTIKPSIKVYGVQALNAPSMLNSIRDKKIETLASVNTIADGIAVKTPGEITFEIVSKYVDDIVTVSDDEISAAILKLLEKEKIICEGAGATSVAALMFNKIDIKDKKVCCVLSGGNLDVTFLSKIIKRGLMMSGRNHKLKIDLIDKPNELAKVSSIIGKTGANIKTIQLERTNEHLEINHCYASIQIETKSFDHIKQIEDELINKGSTN